MKMEEYQRTEFFEYLDCLRDSGVTNMFGAAPFLAEEFGIDKRDARAILLDWIETYSQRHAST